MPLTDNAILVLGAHRSGTTWLGKIFDSHPDVVYRHEPDHGDPDTVASRATIRRWMGNRSERSAAKRPFFRKSWQSATGFWLRSVIAAALSVAVRLPSVSRYAAPLEIPDFGHGKRAVLKSIDWCYGAGAFARLFPHSRTIVILRHPCGQVASVMRGTRQGQFSLREAGTAMPYDEAATVRFVAERGLDERAFRALPAAAKYAWDWVRFNEAALRALQALPNARIVIYEELCARPEATARNLLAFCGLDWTAQTQRFIDNSTHDANSTGYFAVFRDSIAAAERWRTTMSPEDQKAVMSVARQSPLLQFWNCAKTAPI